MSVLYEEEYYRPAFGEIHTIDDKEMVCIPIESWQFYEATLCKYADDMANAYYECYPEKEPEDGREIRCITEAFLHQYVEKPRGWHELLYPNGGPVFTLPYFVIKSELALIDKDDGIKYYPLKKTIRNGKIIELSDDECEVKPKLKDGEGND